MGVTIDSLQIEIQSSSTNAAKGIDDLSKSLEGLKKNGSFKTVSNNLNNLSAALDKLPNVHRASNALRTLANSIERLKEVGSVASLANSIKKLPESLKSLESVDTAGAADQVERLVFALEPLTRLKASGFSSMVNSMAKIEKVTASLSTEKIAAFAAKIKELDAAIGPFATKMGTISTAFKGLNTAIKQTNVSIASTNAEVNVTTLNFSNLMSSIEHIGSILQPIALGFANIVDNAAQWDGIATRFGKGFGDQAQETYEWIQRLNEEMGINVQQFMQYSSTYATMLKGFGVAQEDSSKMALGYMELTYDIWAAHNDMYKTLEDAADAVRSAIAGEVEPVRHAGFTIIESTLQETAANHGLAISLETATEAQKSYLRYLTMVDQARATELVGTYAKELNTAEGMMRNLSQQVKSLSQSFGSLFLPVLVKVIPWVQAFVELLADGVRWIAAFFGIEIQKVDFSGYGEGADAIKNVGNSADGATNSLKDATDAAKELKNATLGIDELNVISPSSATDGSGGGSGAGGAGGAGGGGSDNLGIDSMWDEAIFDNIQSKVDGIKDKIKGMFDDWLPTLKVIGGALAGWSIAKLLDQFDALTGGNGYFAKISNTLKKLAGTAVLISISFKLQQDAFSDFVSGEGSIKDFLEAILLSGITSFLLYKMWGKGGLAIGLGITATAALSTIIEEGGIDSAEDAAVAITGLATAVGSLALALKELGKAWETVKSAKIIGELGAFISLAKEGGFVSALAAAFPKISSAISAIGTAIGGLSAGALAGIVAAVAAVASAIYFVVKNWDELKQAVKDSTFVSELGEIKEHFDNIKEALGPVYDIVKSIIGILSGFIVGQKILEFLKNLDLDLGKIIETIGAFTLATISAPIVGVINVIVGAVENSVQALSGFITTIRGIVDFIVAIFSGGDVEAACEKMLVGIKDLFHGVLGMAIDPVIDFFHGVIDWFKKLFDVLVGHSIVPDMIDEIVEWFVGLPGKIFGSIEKFVTGIVDKFKGLWADLVAWWNGKTKLKEYTPSIGSIKDKVVSAWNSAKTWWDDKKTAMKSYTPSIGSIYEKLKDRWDNARTWWNEKKTKAKEYTPSIGSIYEKLKVRWDNARDWWNKKKSSMNSYTPSIGSITDKIKSAWNSAKSWWSKYAKLTTKLDVQVPKISVKWDTATAFGKSFKYPTGFSLKFAANGGIFDQGSLIWAGERGPEVMATAAGGKTGVMNVQQMQDAVYEGVYAAVVAAMRNRGDENGGQSVNVYLDGRQITAAVEQRQRERGATIMGNEVYSY